MFFSRNKGYSGYSMSNRAVDAYDNGEKPMSKWTKAELIENIEELRPEIVNAMKRLRKDEICELVLRYSSWHHTSMHYNQTDFYSIDEDLLNEVSVEQIEKIIKNRKQAKTKIKNDEKERYVWAHYVKWENRRKEEIYCYGIVKGNVFVAEGTGEKKFIINQPENPLPLGGGMNGVMLQ